ncbi:MAG: hypothetical protein AVDCRST_MAG25-3182, partial [uncultured Rubrobacteraceae bacterium]
ARARVGRCRGRVRPDPAFRAAASGAGLPEGGPDSARDLAGTGRPDAVLGLDAWHDRGRRRHADGGARRLLGGRRRGADRVRRGEARGAPWL